MAQVLDSLIKQGGGQIPPEVGELVQIGLRLHNECPDIDPVFMERLGQELRQEWARQHEPGPRMLRWPAFLSALGTLLRPAYALRAAAVASLAIALVLFSLAGVAGLRSSVEAGLSQVITVFRHVEVVQGPQRTATPSAPERIETYGSVQEAQAAAGFPLRVPTYLPADLVFQKAILAAGQGERSVSLYYRSSGQELSSSENAGRGSLSISEIKPEAPDQMLRSFPIGSNSARHLVIAGRPALWVKGSWSRTGRWNSAGGSSYLMVQDGDLFLLLYSSLGRSETVRVADSLFQ